MFSLCCLQLQAEETIELTAERFAKIVAQKNPQILIDKIYPLIQRSILTEEYKKKFHSRLEINYAQNRASGKPRIQQSSVKTKWYYRIPPIGTIAGVTLDIQGKKMENKPNPNPLAPNALAPDTESWNSTLGFFVNQPLLLGLIYLKPQLELKAQRYNAQIQSSVFNIKLSKKINAALRNYYDYIVNLQKVELLKKNLGRNKEILKFNKRKMLNKTLNKKYFLLNQIQILNYEIEIEDAEKSLNKLLDQILFHMGYDSQKNKKLKIKILDNQDLMKKDMLFDVEDSFKKALGNRNDILTTKIEIEAAKNGLKIGKSHYFPKLDASFGVYLNGTGDKINDAFKNIASSSKSGQAVDIRWGLQFSMYTDITHYKIMTNRANLNLLQAKRKMKKLKKEIYIETKKNISDLLLAKKRIEQISRMLKLRKEHYAISRKDYLNGKIDFSQNTQVDIDLKKTHINYFDAKRNFYNVMLSHYDTEGTLCEKYLIEKLDIEKEVKLKNISNFVNTKSDEIEKNEY